MPCLADDPGETQIPRYARDDSQGAARRVQPSPGRGVHFPIPGYPVPMPADLTERLLRGLYSAVLYLLVPVTVYHLIWRGFR